MANAALVVYKSEGVAFDDSSWILFVDGDEDLESFEITLCDRIMDSDFLWCISIVMSVNSASSHQHVQDQIRSGITTTLENSELLRSIIGLTTITTERCVEIKVVSSCYHYLVNIPDLETSRYPWYECSLMGDTGNSCIQEDLNNS